MNNRDLLLREYEEYQMTEESFIVSMIKIHAKDLDTITKWIDVVDYDCWRWVDGKPCFNYFIIELFDRKIRPKYPPQANIALKRAITWSISHEDINAQRRLRIKGPMFLVTCSLININNRNKVITPKWEYKITGIIQIDDHRLRYIQNNYDNIYSRIIKERKININWLLNK